MQGLCSLNLASGGLLRSLCGSRLSSCDLVSRTRKVSVVNVSHPAGVRSCTGAQSYCCVYPLGGDQDLPPRLHYFLTAPPWSLHPLPSFPDQHLFGPALGTQGRSRRLRGACSLQTRHGGHRKACAQEPHRALLSFSTPYLTEYSCSSYFSLCHCD